jgi:hypothetical protein
MFLRAGAFRERPAPELLGSAAFGPSSRSGDPVMNRVKLLLALAALLGSVTLLSGHDNPRKDEPMSRDRLEDKKVAELMQSKLKHSQKVLEGLAVGNFETIASHAEDLIAVSKQAEWRVLKTPQYEMRSNEFRRAADELVKHARAKNLDAATLSYVEMTMICVKCHKHVREVRLADK